MAEEVKSKPENKTKLNISLDYKLITVVLLVVIAAMLALWRPWYQSSGSDERIISVTGEAKISAEPDEYVFNPNYEFKGRDKTVVLAELSKKSSEIVAKLKDLGVEERNIKTSSGGYDNRPYPVDGNNSETGYNLAFTVKVSQRDLAQKVQDYLVTTTPTGSVTPQATFSDARRKEIENQARDKAASEARSKAEQSAKNLGFKVGSVKSVEDGTGFGVHPYPERGAIKTMIANDTAMPQLGVQPGENELTYTVTVTYFLR